MDGLGRSCLALVLLAMVLDPNLPATLAVEHVRQCRGHAAIQTVKVKPNQFHIVVEMDTGTT